MIQSLVTFFALGVGDPCTFPVKKGVFSEFLNFPHWYQYLPGVGVSTDVTDKNAAVVCNPQLGSLNDAWLIVAAVIEILLRIAALAAVAMVIYGGVKYITSQGEPDKTNRARGTIMNALIGLLLAVMASAFVNFIAGSIK